MLAKHTLIFFRSDFRSKGYFAYSICADLIELSGWTFDEIFNCLGNELGILGLECLARCCHQVGKFDRFSDVVEKFKNYDGIKMNDVCYLYREIVSKRGFSFKDLVKVVDSSEGFELKDFVDLAKNAVESKRTFLEEFEHQYE